MDLSSPYIARLLDAPPGTASVPVVNVYCIGRNYAEHARELGNQLEAEPVVFLKTVTALRGLASGDLAYPTESFHHEAEIVLLVGRPVALGSKAGWDAVSGLGLGLDLTRREVQTQLKAKGLPWTSAKSFAGAGLLSDFVPVKRFPQLDSITFTFKVGGVLKQQGDSANMLANVPALLTFLASAQRLVPGDIVFTGTPAGVGPLRQGDSFTLSFTQLALDFHGRL